MLTIGTKNVNKIAIGDKQVNKVYVGENKVWSRSIFDTVPYLFRRSGGGLNIGDRENDKLIGGTIAWNQLIKNGNFSDTTYWSAQDCALNVANNVATLTPTSAMCRISTEIPIINGHKYFRALTVQGTEGVASLSWYGALLKDVALNGTLQRVEDIIDNTYATTNWVFQVIIRQNTNLAEIKVSQVECVDLTLMFGATIADYAYNLETATAGAGIAWLKAHGFFTKPYYAYNAGSLESVNASAHIMRDENDTIIGNYPLDDTLTLNGLYKLDADNKLYCDGDTYESDGTVTRKYGKVDLETLTWTYNSENAYFSATISAKATGSLLMLCQKYVTGNNTGQASITSGEITAGSINKNIYIKDSAYSDAATFKAAMSGVYLVYELATPTTETADPYTNPQVVDKDGTEEYVDAGVEAETRDVAVPVGHETEYFYA